MATEEYPTPPVRRFTTDFLQILLWAVLPFLAVFLLYWFIAPESGPAEWSGLSAPLLGLIPALSWGVPTTLLLLVIGVLLRRNGILLISKGWIGLILLVIAGLLTSLVFLALPNSDGFAQRGLLISGLVGGVVAGARTSSLFQPVS